MPRLNSLYNKVALSFADAMSADASDLSDCALREPQRTA